VKTPGDGIKILHVQMEKKKTKVTKKPPNAVIYTRVSDPKNDDNQSIEQQEETCRKYCKENNLNVLTVFKEPRGSAFEGRRRKVFESMISYCEQHQQEIYAVVVFNLKRFYRDTAGHFQTRRHLDNIGITLRTPQVELGDSPSQIFMETVFAGEATLESNVKKVDAKASQIKTRRKGRLTQRAPLGYLNRRQLEGPRRTFVVHDPERAPIIAECFRIFANSNRSKVDIYKWAVSKGLTNRKTKKPVSLHFFNEMFENCAYAGIVHVVDVEYVVAEYEPIISVELFEQVQSKLMKDTTSRVPHSQSHTGRPLQGIVRCPECGKYFSGSHRPGKNKTKLYGYYHTHRHEEGCSMKGLHLPVGLVEAGIIVILERIHTDQSILDSFRKVICEQQVTMRKQINRDTKQLEKDKEEQEKIKAGLLKLYALQAIDKDDYSAGIEGVKSDLARIALDESNCKNSSLPLDYIVDRAVMALEHLDVLWKMSSEQDKSALAKTLFPDGFRCDKKGTVGTPSDAHQFGLLTLLDTPDIPLALPRGIEPRFPA
jgi:site-specific DNA recombinase